MSELAQLGACFTSCVAHVYLRAQEGRGLEVAERGLAGEIG